MSVRRVSILLFVLSIAALPLYGHHGRGATYDMKKRITLKGTVSRVDWRNPHVVIFMDVKDEAGKVTNWGFEMGPPHGLQGRGWTRETMKLGDEVLVNGSRAKNGSNRVNARTVTMTKTGTVLGAASSEGTTNP